MLGADGTDHNQIYIMFVPQNAKTCTEAHVMISGLKKETSIVMQS
jgi:hypothetical protein